MVGRLGGRHAVQRAGRSASASLLCVLGAAGTSWGPLRRVRQARYGDLAGANARPVQSIARGCNGGASIMVVMKVALNFWFGKDGRYRSSARRCQNVST